MANFVLKAWQDALPMYFWSKNHNCLLKWIDIHRISGWFCVGGKSNQVNRYLTPTQNIDIVKGGASTYDDGAVFVWDIQTACRIGWQEFLWIDFIFQILFCCFFICCLNISCDRLQQILFRWPTNPRTNSWKTHPFYSKFQFPGHELGRSMENSSTYQIRMSFPEVGQTNDREIEMSGKLKCPEIEMTGKLKFRKKLGWVFQSIRVEMLPEEVKHLFRDMWRRYHPLVIENMLESKVFPTFSCIRPHSRTIVSIEILLCH